MIGGMVLAIAVIVMFAYVYERGRFSAVIYRYTGSGKWLYSTLKNGVKNGDTIEQVENLLGPGQKADAKIYSVSKKFAAINPSGYPEGCEEDDEFLGFRLPGEQLYLQFRNGVLINFDPAEFEEYTEVQMVGQ